MNREEFYRFVSESKGNESNICQICAIKNGQVAYEASWRGYKADDAININSVTKGVMALLAGIAVDKGFIKSIDGKVIDFFPDYQVKKGEKTIYDVTLKHLLTMTAPYKGKSEPWKKVCTSDDWTKAALDFLGGRKGITGEFRYATLGIQILAGVIERSTGEKCIDFANRNLFLPLGIPEHTLHGDSSKEDQFDFFMNKGPRKNEWYSDPKDTVTAGWGLCLSGQDLATLGDMVLHEGEYDGKQIVSAGWIRQITTPSLDETQWWKAAQEEDQRNGTGPETTDVNPGETPSDDIGSYLGGNNSAGSSVGAGTSQGNGGASSTTGTPSVPPQPVVPETSSMDDLLQRSIPVQQLSGRHYPFGRSGSLNIRAYELTRGEIKQNGERKPCHFNADGIDCDFIYDPTHPLLAQYPITPKMLLLIYIAERLKARDALPDVVSVYSSLVSVSMGDSRIDRQALVDRSSSVFELMREKITEALRPYALEAVRCIHESTGEVEETVANIINVNPALLLPFQNATSDGFDAIEFVPPKTLYRLVDRFPENLFDGKAFSTPYLGISLSDENATIRAREAAKDRILSFIKDALRIVTGYGQRVQKEELTRASLSVDFLVRELES